MKTTTTTPATADSMRQAAREHADSMRETKRAIKAKRRRERVQAIRNGLILVLMIVCGLFCGYVEASAKEANTGRQTAMETGNQTGTREAKQTTMDKAARKAARRTEKAIRAWSRKTYGKGYRVIIKDAETITDKELSARKGKRLVYVDRYTTRADKTGRAGIVTTAGPFKGKKLNYAARQTPNKTVVTYIIYSPHTNSPDDAAALATAGRIAD